MWARTTSPATTAPQMRGPGWRRAGEMAMASDYIRAVPSSGEPSQAPAAAASPRGHPDRHPRELPQPSRAPRHRLPHIQGCSRGWADAGLVTYIRPGCGGGRAAPARPRRGCTTLPEPADCGLAGHAARAGAVLALVLPLGGFDARGVYRRPCLGHVKPRARALDPGRGSRCAVVGSGICPRRAGRAAGGGRHGDLMATA